MHYEILVTKDNKHLFATSPRSCPDEKHALEVFRHLRGMHAGMEDCEVTISLVTEIPRDITEEFCRRLQLGWTPRCHVCGSSSSVICWKDAHPDKTICPHCCEKNATHQATYNRGEGEWVCEHCGVNMDDKVREHLSTDANPPPSRPKVNIGKLKKFFGVPRDPS